MTGRLQRFKHSEERAGITTEVVTGESGAVAAIAALVERLKVPVSRPTRAGGGA